MCVCQRGCVCMVERGPPSGGLAPYTDLCLDTAYTLVYTLSDTDRQTKRRNQIYNLFLRQSQNFISRKVFINGLDSMRRLVGTVQCAIHVQRS